MKEAIGTAEVFNIILVFIVVFIGLYVGAISFSKAFKVKNRIVQIIEKHQGYTDLAKEEIAQNLKDVGYRIVKKNCGSKKGIEGVQDSSYGYCIYEFNGTPVDETSDVQKFPRGTYYGVKVFIHVDIPLIGDFIDIPLYSETRLTYMKDRVELE